MGQLGSALAVGLARNKRANIIAFDPHISPERRQIAQDESITLAASMADLSTADFVLSAVTAKSAGGVAQQAADAIADNATFIDLNSLGGDEKRANAAILAQRGKRFIDAAVLGPAADGIDVPMIMSGEDAESVSAKFNDLGFTTRPVGPEPGQASTIKIVRSLLAKGLEALYVEALVAAHRLGIEHEVLDTFAQMLDARPAKAMADILVTTHVIHAERRMHEMAMSINTIEQAGIAPHMARAAYRVLEDTALSPINDKSRGKLPGTRQDAIQMLDKTYGQKASL
jgi:3-hydroxyisobutyrate dehydrogenase-like beta-hydroxyacid dehydrogenase